MKLLKLLLIAAVIAATPGSLFARKNEGTFNAFYHEYKKRSDFVSITVPCPLASLLVDKDDKALRKLLRNMDNARILVYDNNPDSVKYFAKELNRNLPPDKYSDLMTVNDGGDKVTLKIRTRGDIVTELIIMAIDKGSFVALSLSGEVALSTIRKLVSGANAGWAKNMIK